MSVRPTLLCGRSVCHNSLALSCQVCHADLVLQLTCLSRLVLLYHQHVITVSSVTLVLLCDWRACQTSAALRLTCYHCQFRLTGLALWLTCLSDQCCFVTDMSQQSCFITVRSVCDSFLLSLIVTLYIFLHLTAMYSFTFKKGWVGG